MSTMVVARKAGAHTHDGAEADAGGVGVIAAAVRARLVVRLGRVAVLAVLSVAAPTLLVLLHRWRVVWLTRRVLVLLSLQALVWLMRWLVPWLVLWLRRWPVRLLELRAALLMAPPRVVLGVCGGVCATGDVMLLLPRRPPTPMPVLVMVVRSMVVPLRCLAMWLVMWRAVRLMLWPAARAGTRRRRCGL